MTRAEAVRKLIDATWSETGSAILPFGISISVTPAEWIEIRNAIGTGGGEAEEQTQEDAARWRWFRDECGLDRQAEIVEVSEGVADMLEHHVDKGRVGL